MRHTQCFDGLGREHSIDSTRERALLQQAMAKNDQASGRQILLYKRQIPDRRLSCNSVLFISSLILPLPIHRSLETITCNRFVTFLLAFHSLFRCNFVTYKRCTDTEPYVILSLLLIYRFSSDGRSYACSAILTLGCTY